MEFIIWLHSSISNRTSSSFGRLIGLQRLMFTKVNVCAVINIVIVTFQHTRDNAYFWINQFLNTWHSIRRKYKGYSVVFTFSSHVCYFKAFISALSASSKFCIRWSSIQALLSASFQFSTSNLATSPLRLPLTNVILVHAIYRISTKLCGVQK